MEYGESNYLPLVSISASCTFSFEATVIVCSPSISGTAFSVVVRFGMLSGLARSAPLVSSIHMGKYIRNKISILSNTIIDRYSF